MPAATVRDHPLAADLDLVLDYAAPAWTELRGARIYVTGGTGFVGTWLLESFAWANARLGLGARLVVLTRDPAAFAGRLPHLVRDSSISVVHGDVRRPVELDGAFSHVIHGATAASAKLNEARPLEMLETIVDGTRRTMEAAERAGATRLLMLSSGAVYGQQPPGITHVDEECTNGPDPLLARNAYAEGKRVAELESVVRGQDAGIAVAAARMFAFVGPHLPLDAHFAIGNFIGDALAGRTISLNGDGSPYRSYLYAADLAAWLWVMLVRGEHGRAYNVGSEEGLPLWDVARLVSSVLREHGTGAPVRAKEPVPGAEPSWYVPSTARARRELGLETWTPLPEAIRRTYDFHAGARATR